MKKYFSIPCLVIILAVGLSAQVRLGLSGGYALPSDSHFKGGIGPSLQIGINFSQTFALEIGWARFQGDAKGIEEGLGPGKLTRMPIELSLQGRMPFDNERIVPYLFFGGGYSMNDFAPAASVTSPWSDVGITVTEATERSASFHAGLGIDFFVAGKLAFNINAKYMLSLANGSWTQTDGGTGLTISGNTDKMKMDALIVNLGLKYSF